ncbi:hypothetical protein DFP73DRAFT_600755 [Morchella snyderi]|nr:hypothetical protein DFP73DRAFT_600755 [Morchella snyderi]
MLPPAKRNLANLPPELLLHIAAHLPSRSLCMLGITCRSLHNLFDHLRTARFTPPNFTYQLVHVQWGRRVPDYERRLAALNYAAGKGCTGVVRRLVDYHGMPVDGHASAGPSPLVRALRRGHAETVRWLLAAGAVVPAVYGGEGEERKWGVEMEAVLEEFGGRVGV